MIRILEFRKSMIKILPVIHYLNDDKTIVEINKACSIADGCFLISHKGEDNKLWPLASEATKIFSNKLIGVNGLSTTIEDMVAEAFNYNIKNIWLDDVGIHSGKCSKDTIKLARWANSIKIFGSIAFKYQKIDHFPNLSARLAKNFGFIPTTSGLKTGTAPDISKLIAIKQAIAESYLAVASGINESNFLNISKYANYLLISTGIAKDEYTIDINKLDNLVKIKNSI